MQRLINAAYPFVFAQPGLTYGQATSETFSDGRSPVWDCSYFWMRVIRNLIGNAAWGRNRGLDCAIASAILRNWHPENPKWLDQVSDALTSVFLLRAPLGTTNAWNVIHVGFVLGDNMHDRNYSGVLDFPNVGVFDTPGFHYLKDWFTGVDIRQVPVIDRMNVQFDVATDPIGVELPCYHGTSYNWVIMRAVTSLRFLALGSPLGNFGTSPYGGDPYYAIP